MRIVSFFILVLFFSCTGADKAVETVQQSKSHQESKKPEKTHFDESFDPLTLTDNPWVIQKKSQRHKEQVVSFSDTNTVGSVSRKDPKEHVGFGFRVQLYSTTDYYMALGVRDEASAKLNEDIYVDYEQPYYKVRAGNFTDREKAEEIKNLAKTLGYADAWVIQTNVLLREQ